jgi:hypothetical protein
LFTPDRDGNDNFDWPPAVGFWKLKHPRSGDCTASAFDVHSTYSHMSRLCSFRADETFFWNDKRYKLTVNSLVSFIEDSGHDNLTFFKSLAPCKIYSHEIKYQPIPVSKTQPVVLEEKENNIKPVSSNNGCLGLLLLIILSVIIF